MKRARSIFVLGLAACVFMQGCSSSSRSMHDVPPTPVGVSEELHKRCHADGVSAGAQAIADMSKGAETFSLLTGGLGAIFALSAAVGVRESAYTSAYDECLRGGEGKQERTPNVIEDDDFNRR